MNQFQEMIREAFRGDDAFDASPDRGQLETAIDNLHKRDRIMRVLMWTHVTLMSALMFWAGWTFMAAPEDASTKYLVLRATLFLWGIAGVAFAKGLLFVTQRETGIQRELKRMQLLLLERRDP